MSQRLCTHCQKPLARNAQERPYAFMLRKTCGQACATARREGVRQKCKVKLTDDVVRAIKWKLVSGETIIELAKSHGLGVNTIRNIHNGVTWRHVEI